MSNRSFFFRCARARLAEDAISIKIRRLQLGRAAPGDVRALGRIHRRVLGWIGGLPEPAAGGTGPEQGQLGVGDRRVEVVPYDGRWPAIFAAEAGRLRSALGGEEAEIHHIGSTSIPGLAAKPIIDLALALPGKRIAEGAEEIRGRLQSLGYRYLGDWGRRGGRVFVKADTEGARREFLCQIHAAGSPDLRRTLRLREMLLGDPAALREYETVKRKLAAALPRHRLTYVWAKGHYLNDRLLEERTEAAWAQWYLEARYPTLARLARRLLLRALCRAWGGRGPHPMAA